MANYAATKTVVVYNTIEEAVAGLETALEAIAQGKANLKFDVIKIEANKYAAWTMYTDAA